MVTEQTPLELTMDLIEKSGIDIHHACVAKYCAVIQMPKYESPGDIQRVVEAFNNRWGHAYEFDGFVNNPAVKCTMIYFKAR